MLQIHVDFTHHIILLPADVSLCLLLSEERQKTDWNPSCSFTLFQSQLNRILEHYLRKAKLTSLKAGYKLKSVISSAVAKEREIYDSSNTKGVYVNLCVRALAQQDEVRLQVTIPQPAEPDEAGAVAEALLATGLISDSPPGSPCEKHSPSTEIGKVLPGNQPPEYSPIVKEVPQAGDVEDVLDISKPESSHVYGEMDLDLEVRSSEGSAARVPRPIASSTHPVSSKNNMKVVFTSSTTISSSQVPINREKNPEESSTGRGTVRVICPSWMFLTVMVGCGIMSERSVAIVVNLHCI